MNQLACVFGNPIKQSKSPTIHHAFANQFDIKLSYTAEFLPLNEFAQGAKAFLNQHEAVGANVTLPFKEQALLFADELNPHAAKAGAANTLIKLDNKIIADNTDGRGLVADLKRNDVDLAGKRVLVIGAGGASKGAIPAIEAEQPSLIHIQNRTKSKAAELLDAVSKYTTVPIGFYEVDSAYDVIINATSLSLNNEVPPLVSANFGNECHCYDMVYLNEPTAFLKQAEHFGASKSVDGIGMLVGQAAESFYLWFGEKPDVVPVLSMMKNQNS